MIMSMGVMDKEIKEIFFYDRILNKDEGNRLIIILEGLVGLWLVNEGGMIIVGNVS